MSTSHLSPSRNRWVAQVDAQGQQQVGGRQARAALPPLVLTRPERLNPRHDIRIGIEARVGCQCSLEQEAAGCPTAFTARRVVVVALGREALLC